MIDMNDLKPILQPLLNDENTASVIESITAIDKDDYVSKTEIDKINKEWNDRYTKTFFGGTPITESVANTNVSDPIVTTEASTNEVVEEKEPTTYDDLFKEE